MQDCQLLIIGLFDWNIKLRNTFFAHPFNCIDDAAWKMHNIVLGTDFGQIVRLISNLIDQSIYYKDMFLLMSASDKE